jgi:hypothetical protein
VVRHTWTTEVQGTLDFPHAQGASSLQKKPVDLPRFAAELILKFCFIVHVQ